MSKLLKRSILPIFVAFALLISTASSAFASSLPKSEAEMEGTILSLSGSSLSITPKKGGSALTVTVDAAARIRRNSKTVPLSDLQVGDKVNVKYDKATLIATKVDAKSISTQGSSSSSKKVFELKGVIASVSGNSITITPKKGGAVVTIMVDSTSKIKRNGKTVTVSSLLAGDKIELKYSGATMIASRIEAKGAKLNSNSNSNTNTSNDDNSNPSNDNSNTSP